MFNSEKSEICKETCIVLDHSSNFLQTSGSKLDLEPVQKSKSSKSFLSILQKTTWTCMVEGVAEYCRIVYDVLPTSYKILVLCSDQEVSNVNSFEDGQQNIQQVLKGLGEVGAPKDSSEFEGLLSVYPGVARGAEDLLKYGKNENVKSSKRLIVITNLQDESDAKSISNVVWELQNQHDKTSLCHMDLVVVNISDGAEKISHSKRQVSSHLDVTTLMFKNSQCSNKIALLSRKHFSLGSTIITGIPMKEEQNAGTSANYDVEIIHSAAAHNNAEFSNAFDNSSNTDNLIKCGVTLKWCTPKANAIHDLQHCVGAYRVTPAEVNSRPAACLIMFLLQGRTVMLEEPKKAGVKVLTHMLASHGGDVYIHVLLPGKSPLDDPPSISEGVGGRVTDYRVNDFGKFMKQNRLAPYVDVTEEDDPNKKAISRLERYSKHWPMVISETLVFNMQANLDPLLTLLLKPVLTEEEVQECKKVIYKLQAMESRNDTLPLPIVTLKGKGSKKEDQYKQVWSELDLFIEGASKTSFMHKKVLHCIRGSQESQLPSEPKVNEDLKNNESSATDKSWNELDRYQQMTEREQKAFNEVPSDPRRRRRISEGSATKPTEPQVQPPKKSPRREEAPSKIRRANTMSSNRGYVSNMTPVIQAKSSLLSIWSDHLNLTASRFHEEFNGRKHAVSGKFELYQKDQEQTGQSEQKQFNNNKTVKEWV